jgi:hypothetical protein
MTEKFFARLVRSILLRVVASSRRKRLLHAYYYLYAFCISRILILIDDRNILHVVNFRGQEELPSLQSTSFTPEPLLTGAT